MYEVFKSDSRLWRTLLNFQCLTRYQGGPFQISNCCSTGSLITGLEKSHSCEEILKHAPWYSWDAAQHLPIVHVPSLSSYISHNSKISPLVLHTVILDPCEVRACTWPMPSSEILCTLQEVEKNWIDLYTTSSFVVLAKRI